ncbi:HNH endonuclease family protein [Neisseria dentiae]|uniref:HNH endonuclease family protein n=2 Tax=Neisseria dentiae TaxID=194197 RepID=UPI00359F3C61
MKIELKQITVRELVKDYQDSAENGVRAYGGKLDVRPPYQREFVYKDKQRDAVIETVRQGFPLNVMYWAKRDDGTFEVIDGQQRTISLCQYVEGDFAYLMRYFHNLQADEQQQIWDYELMVYVCEGSDSEKLKWFETINIAGEKLTAQELRNAVYAGSWLADAKRYFSKTGCAAYQIGQDYVSGSPIRQEFLETALDWISDGHIEAYMAKHQNHPNALALWQYFQAVMTWVEATFPNKRKKFMKGQDWGRLYNRFKDEVLDSKRLEAEIAVLMQDDEVENKKGIYPYVLTREEKYLNLRTFSDGMKQKLYEHQGGICPMCKETFLIEQMEGDHITPWSQGGKTTLENGQMLCKNCNRRKSDR